MNLTVDMLFSKIQDQCRICDNVAVKSNSHAFLYHFCNFRALFRDITTRGMGAAEMQVIADCIADCIWHYEEKKDEISERVLRLTREFPLYQ